MCTAFKTFAFKQQKEIEKKKNLGLPPVPFFGGAPDPDRQAERRMQSLQTRLQGVPSSDPRDGHLLLLADLVEQLHVLHHRVGRAVDAVVLGAKHGRDTGSVVPHEALHELHQQVPAVVGYHAGAVLHLATETTARKCAAGRECFS